MEQIAYRIPDAATLIGVSRASIYNLVNAGSLDARKVAGRTVITADSLKRLVETAPAAPIARHAV